MCLVFRAIFSLFRRKIAHLYVSMVAVAKRFAMKTVTSHALLCDPDRKKIRIKLRPSQEKK